LNRLKFLSRLGGLRGTDDVVRDQTKLVLREGNQAVDADCTSVRIGHLINVVPRRISPSLRLEDGKRYK